MITLNGNTVPGILRAPGDSRNRTAPEGADKSLPEILFITTYPPRECGIATYSHDLIGALNDKFDHSFTFRICPIESGNEACLYPEYISEVLHTSRADDFPRLARAINENPSTSMVVIQHEFGLFENKESEFQDFLAALTKPAIVSFHTVLPHPGASLKLKVKAIAGTAESLIVMTKSSKNILELDYGVARDKITVIPHGTHLVPYADKGRLKKKYGLSGKTVLSTFGLLSSGKGIETTLDALPAIIRKHADVRFLVIGKTHPSVIQHEGEKYRMLLENKVTALGIRDHVTFINHFLPLPELLEYLQLTDVYLFTSRDPNQAVSGTFSYAVSCGCPVVSTPIPHAREVLEPDAGVIVDFENPGQLSDSVNKLLLDKGLRNKISMNALQRIASTAWENAAIAHAGLFKRTRGGETSLRYNPPVVNLDHVRKLTTEFGMVQFARINKPDMQSGYTLDDNARALIAMCQHFELTIDEADIEYIRIYLSFIKHCQQPEGHFLNYVDERALFTDQNYSTNLADANGRALWALGYLLSLADLLPQKLAAEATAIFDNALPHAGKLHSTRAMAFVIKGLYYRSIKHGSTEQALLIKELANRLVQMYRHEADNDWKWFESYLTYANSVLPEAMLCAWSATGEPAYKEIAESSFDFLLAMTFKGNTIRVISNKAWLHKGEARIHADTGGEQPIDVAYSILALSTFYAALKNEKYLVNLRTAFDWFLGNNHLHQIVYNPCTGGCYDGLESNDVNLNQGAESTLSYLMARLTLGKYFGSAQHVKRLHGHYLKSAPQAA